MPSPREHDANAVPLLDPSHELPAHASSANSGGEQPHSGSWLRVVVIILIIAAAVAFVVWRIRTNKSADQQQGRRAAAMADRPVPVTITPVSQRSIPIYLTALGTVTAYNTVTLKSRVDGQITAINFREGESVKQGQLLIQIDPRPYQAALAQAQGNLARDQANAGLAKAQANRYTALYQAGVVSRESEQTQQSTAGQSAGTIQGDEAAIQAARVNLSYTRITSPISGVVGLRQVDIGNIIAANSSTGLLVITQIQPIAVIFTLPEDQLPEVFDGMKGGRKLVVEAWDRANTTKIATGQLLTVDNQIDTTTGTAKLKAVFPNNDNALFPNQFVNIRLVLETRNNAVVVPAAAIQTGTNGNFIYVVDMQHPVAPTEVPGEGGKKPGNASSEAAPGNGTGTGAGRSGRSGRSAGGARPSQTAYPVQSRPVKVDLTQGTDVIIASGVHPGEKVVIDGQEKLRDGSKVIPTTRDITANPPANPSNGVGASGNSPDTVHQQSPSRTGQKSNGASHP